MNSLGDGFLNSSSHENTQQQTMPSGFHLLSDQPLSSSSSCVILFLTRSKNYLATPRERITPLLYKDSPPPGPPPKSCSSRLPSPPVPRSTGCHSESLPGGSFRSAPGPLGTPGRKEEYALASTGPPSSPPNFHRLSLEGRGQFGPGPLAVWTG